MVVSSYLIMCCPHSLPSWKQMCDCCCRMRNTEAGPKKKFIFLKRWGVIHPQIPCKIFLSLLSKGPCCHDNSKDECVNWETYLSFYPSVCFEKFFSWHVCGTWTSCGRLYFSYWWFQLLSYSVLVLYWPLLCFNEAQPILQKSIVFMDISWSIIRLHFIH